MTPLQKLRSIQQSLINFDGNPGKLPPIARQMDILGSGIDSKSKAYKELGKARKAASSPKGIIKALEHLANAESDMMDE